jgi:hypothetical protein
MDSCKKLDQALTATCGHTQANYSIRQNSTNVLANACLILAGLDGLVKEIEGIMLI